MWILRPPHAPPPGPVDAGAVVRSLQGPPGAYVHVPFCRTSCPFCPYDHVRYRREAVPPYVTALLREARAYGTHLEGPYTSLYVGGGTPTLCIDEMEPVLAALPVRGERAIEVIPTHATPETLCRLLALGFTHVSLGIQSFDPGVLRHLGRPHGPEANHAALANARGHFACVDVDLVFDTAFASVETFLDDVRTCFAAGVDQVSTYPLMRFGMTPFGKGPHDPRLEHDALGRAEGLAARWGYERRSVWTFHRDGAPAYSSITRPYFLGLGAGAATFTGRRFHVNHFGTDRYVADLEANRLPVARELALGAWHAAAYRVFWQLYTGHLDGARAERDSVATRSLARLAGLGTLSGHLARRGRALVLTRRGYDAYHDLERWVTYRYIEPLWAELTRERDAASPESR